MTTTGSRIVLLLMTLAGLSLAAEAVRADYLDPKGDTFAPSDPSTYATDIARIDGYREVVGGEAYTTFVVSFFNTVTSPNSGEANSLRAFIDLDVADRGADELDPAVANVNAFAPSSLPLVDVRPEYYINASLNDGNGPAPTLLRSADDGIVGAVDLVLSDPDTVDGVSGYQTATIRVRDSLLGGLKDTIRYGVIVGSPSAVSDRGPDSPIGPNGMIPALEIRSVPEPGTLALVGLGLIGATFGRFASRRAA